MWIKKSEYELLTKSYIRLSKEIGDIRSELDRIEVDGRRYEDAVKRHNRILKHSTKDGIGYCSNYEFKEGVLSTHPYTNIYYDLEEYCFSNLYLCNPIFKISEENDMIINVRDVEDEKDKRKVVYYTLDLENENFVCTKKEVIWKKK